jgi:hypothetical protein
MGRLASVELEPVAKPVRILIGGTVRKSPDLLRAHLASIDGQILPPRVVLTPAFVDDNVVEESSEVLKEWVLARQGIYLDARTSERPAFSDSHPTTHQWSGDAMQRVGQLKNGLIKECLAGGYDGLWLLDSDLILSPRVLWSLYYSDVPIACAVFWTRWQATPECPPLPQVWLRHPYELSGRGMEMPEFLRRLHGRERLQVWGQGACTLYRNDALTKGVSFDFLPDLPQEGMWQGEDRHLCVRAERLHVPMYADAWPDIAHIYHPSQQEQAGEWLETLALESEGSPGLSDLVSLTTQAVEPVQSGPGQWTHLGKQHVRGVLGRLGLCPELEAAVKQMKRGDARIISVNYPMWSESQFRGQKRLIQVTLVDWKFNDPPVGT